MDNKLWKIGFFTGLTSFVLLIVGIRTILGQTLIVKNYLTFGVFGLIVGIMAALLLFYELKIAFRIFMIAVILAFTAFFLNLLMARNNDGSLRAILDLFIITSFGLGLAFIVQFIIIFIRKNK
ncbi:hypothetical protein [Sporosarcina limicola]|uniref:Phosphoglycerol transferase MdoB-like AlkP superfamily enzyme n=1 Tax=Sporosarcina limicola TaxID=34101 RepID=A0A927RCD4_9BACL|nr:hypothetical protein [Sporosarcina limicola]MBE1554250.1 phosphoglycerol transferase MdoB-like AlkP superfamily enzyme [Sporosarcina limicola]